MNNYIKISDLRFYECIQTAFDPAEFSVYSNLSESQNHGRNELRYVVNVLNNKRDMFGHPVGNNYSHNRIYSEYQLCKKFMYKLRNFESGVNKLYLRMKRVNYELFKQKQLFTTLISLWAPIYEVWPAQVDVERDASIRNWMMPKYRQNMGIDFFGAIMRIHCNSPNETEDPEKYKEFIVKCAINWNRMKERNHKIALLDKLTAYQQARANVNVLELVKELKQSG